MTEPDAVKSPSEDAWRRFIKLEPQQTASPSQRPRINLRPVRLPTAVKQHRVAWILDEASQLFGVSVIDLLSARRMRQIARPRQVAIWVARHLTELSLPQIGREFHRDHTTALHACRTIDRLMSEDNEIKERVAALVERVQARAKAERIKQRISRQKFTDEGYALRRIWE